MMIPFAPAPRGPGFGLSLRLALRELRGGLGGFRIFLACLAIGVAAIAGIGSLSRSLSDGLERNGREILGGDASFSIVHRGASPAELAFLAQNGRLSTNISLRAMVRSADGATALVELKAVDDLYPLVGKVVTDPPDAFAAALAGRDGTFGAVADATMMARLGVAVGDTISLGATRLRIGARLVTEPDALSSGFGFGPRLFVSHAALTASDLLQPGSLVRWTYKVALPDGTSIGTVRAFAEAAKERFPDAAWQVRTREQASERLERNIERFTQFLTIVGLTALVVGGVGVANAVAAFVERQREVMATLKCLGATGARVFSIYLTEIMLIAIIGIAIGLAAGAALPFAVAAVFGPILPLPLAPSIQPTELALATAYGLLVALVFAIWPLGRVHDVPVSALFREHVADQASRPRLRYAALVALAFAALVALALATAYDKRVALVFIAGTALTFGALRLVAHGLMAAARRAGRSRRMALRLALANIHRPGALTPSVVLSLGLGLALLVTLTLIDASVRHQLTASLPERAPSFFFVDIPNSDAQDFSRFLHERAPEATVEQVPMLRGRLTRLKGIAAEDYPAPPDAAWVLRGDRGITHSATVPEGSRVTQGSWWAPDHTGDNLVSFDDELARQLGIGIGDKLTVNVLGREIEATVANLRKVDWERLGISFVMVFSPNTFRGAPYQMLATLTYPDGGTDATETALLRAVADRFPAVISVRVKDALATIAGLASDLALGIRAASAVTLIASVLVLAGALAAGHRHRLYDAVILKTLGATRARILGAFALEYLLLGLVTAVVGAGAGIAAAWVITEDVMKIGFNFDIAGAAAAAFGALALTILLGLAGTWRLLGRKPAPVLRAL